MGNQYELHLSTLMNVLKSLVICVVRKESPLDLSSHIKLMSVYKGRLRCDGE
jgi:hypothetical protein